MSPEFSDRLPGCRELTPLHTVVNGADEAAGLLLRSLSDMVAAGQPPASVYVEHVVAVLLLRLSALRTGVPRTGAKPLDPVDMMRVQDYVEANLGADVTLSDLAGLLRLPVDTFARRFRATTGRAPYAYVLGQRVARAARMLGETDLDISAIAMALGFSSQSHLTSTFRREMGTTPHAYRTALRRRS